TDANGNPLAFEAIWAITPGNGGMAGDKNALYFFAGINAEKDGLFGSIRFKSSGGSSPSAGLFVPPDGSGSGGSGSPPAAALFGGISGGGDTSTSALSGSSGAMAVSPALPSDANLVNALMASTPTINPNAPPPQPVTDSGSQVASQPTGGAAADHVF